MLFANCTYIDEFWDVFVNQIQRLVLLYVPFSRLDACRQNNALPRDIKRLIRKKRQAWKRYWHSPTDDSKQRFREISRLCKQVMRAHFAKEEDFLNMNAKNFYQYVSNKPHPENKHIVWESNGNMVTNEQEI